MARCEANYENVRTPARAHSRCMINLTPDWETITIIIVRYGMEPDAYATVDGRLD
jgi:hypothetical protein